MDQNHPSQSIHKVLVSLETSSITLFRTEICFDNQLMRWEKANIAYIQNFALCPCSKWDMKILLTFKLLEITSLPNTNLASINNSITKLTISVACHQKCSLYSLIYRSFLIANVFYVNMINLLLKLSYIDLIGCWLLPQSLSRWEFPLCHVPISSKAINL